MMVTNHAAVWRMSLLAGVVAGMVFACGRAAEDPEEKNLANQRMDAMRDRVQMIGFHSNRKDFPERLEAEPLFRYDDLARGYLDGTVWRLGAEGRPLAIVTAELHPRYGGSPRIVYDFLSLSQSPFSARSADVPGWSPPGPAVAMQPVPKAPAPAESANERLAQMKRLASRFTATQDVEGQYLVLRRLPRPIDRYVPADNEKADGAIFVFAAGRMPGILLFLESDGRTWRYGVGRLSHPCTLTVRLDDEVVWEQPVAVLGWNLPYTASNSPVSIPGASPY